MNILNKTVATPHPLTGRSGDFEGGGYFFVPPTHPLTLLTVLPVCQALVRPQWPVQSGKAHEFSGVSAVAGLTGRWCVGSDKFKGM